MTEFGNVMTGQVCVCVCMRVCMGACIAMNYRGVFFGYRELKKNFFFSPGYNLGKSFKKTVSSENSLLF